MRFSVADESDQVEGGDVMRNYDVGVTIWEFGGFVWLFELSGVRGLLSVLKDYLIGEG